MARNRYGWQKRAKEMARKEKNNDKIKRRQGKTTTSPTEGMPVEVVEVEEGTQRSDGTVLPAGDVGKYI